MPHPVKVAACDGTTFRSGLEMLYRELGARDRAGQIEAAMQELRPDDVWIAFQIGEPIGALLARPGAGRVGWLLPPVLATGPSGSALSPARVARRLIAGAVAKLTRDGMKLIQALVAPESEHRAAFEAAGFVMITELIRMRRSCGPAVPPVRIQGVELLDLNAGPRGVVLRLLEETGRGSLDCPELDTLRTTEEVLANYEQAGVRPKPHILLARRAGELVGCVLVNQVAEGDDWELHYVGVVPAARGQGIGAALCARAVEDARRCAAREIGVSVDVRNWPAVRIYKSLGFRESGRRLVYVRGGRRKASSRSR